MKSISFDYKDKAYSLRFDINALGRLGSFLDGEDTATTFIQFDNSILDVRRIRALFAAGLNVRLSLDSAGQMIEDIGVYEVKALVQKAMQEAMPSISPPKAEAAPPAGKDGEEAGNAKTT